MVGHVVIGRNSTKRLAPCCQSWSRTFWGESRSPPRLPSLLGELVDRSSAGIAPSWLVCPSTHGPRLCFLGLPGQTIVLSLVGSSNHLVSFGGLVERRLVIRRRCAPLVGCWEWGSMKNPYILGSTSPRFVVLPWGIRRRRTLPWAEERTHTTTS